MTALDSSLTNSFLFIYLFIYLLTKKINYKYLFF